MQNSNLEIQHLVSHNTISEATFSRSGLYIKSKICKNYQSYIHRNIKADIIEINENIMITVSFIKDKIKKKAYKICGVKNKNNELCQLSLIAKKSDNTELFKNLFNPLFALLESSNNTSLGLDLVHHEISNKGNLSLIFVVNKKNYINGIITELNSTQLQAVH
jgi:hypothetical protein